jgi:hypothetical protein
MKKIAIMMIILMMTAGCLGSEGLEDMEVGEIVNPEIIWTNSSYQFDNLLPMGNGNHTDLVLNNTTVVYLEIWARFHEPSAWEQGSVNLTLAGPNNYSWSFETTNTTKNLTINFTGAGNYSFRIMAEGSDDPIDNLPGDAYVVYTRFETW